MDVVRVQVHLLLDLLIRDAGDLDRPGVIEFVGILDIIIGRWPLRVTLPDSGDQLLVIDADVGAHVAVEQIRGEADAQASQVPSAVELIMMFPLALCRPRSDSLVNGRRVKGPGMVAVVRFDKDLLDAN
jgi:hypothetical protein